jgi:methylphosphotriester-DNA--protein-cysteine methyltransferase
VRANVLERALLECASADAPRVDALVDAATQLIRGSRGAVRIREIERALGTTERTLQRRFAATVGLTPKEAARVARFAHAASRLRSRPAESLARVALESGYADQPHFTREFQRLAGTTPVGYVREAGVVFVQDDDA